MVGIWKGDARLRIVSGPNDGDNSAIVGTLKTGIAPKTADNHIQSLYSTIGVTTRAAAALYALERGLVQRGVFAA